MPNAYAFTISFLFKIIIYFMHSFFLFGVIRTEFSLWRKVLLFSDVNIYSQLTD